MRLFVTLDVLSTTLPFALSVIYHTFMPHIYGAQLSKRLLKVDVFGVWFAATFGSLSGIYVSLYCFPSICRIYLMIYLLLSLVVLYYLVVVDCKKKRVIALSIQFFFRSFIQLIRLTPLVTVPVMAFYYYFLMYIVSSIGALINALHIPERWYPGKCDYILNGHSLMHVAAIVSIALGRHGLLTDFTWYTNPTCPA